MEQQPPLPAVEAGISQLRQRRSPTRHPRLRRHLLLRLVPAVPLGGSLGWTRQIVYARDVRTGYVRRVAVLRPTDADDPHESPDDHEPSPGAAARQQAGPSASVNWPLRKTA